jgi:hypothetical protein
MEIPFLRAKAVRFKSKDDRERMGERKEGAKNVRSPFDNKRPASRACTGCEKKFLFQVTV